ncbi:hypothetical protein [Qipengyuania flava]|nr:hypothetical protein [Qipengyuania flava]
MARLPVGDREILATRLGEVAAKTAPSPLEGARILFDRAWGPENAHWQKRKRLVRIGDEPAPDARDVGSLVSSGQTWAHLLETAATIMSEMEGGNAEWLRDHQIRRMLYGTSLIPSNDNSAVGSGDTEELISFLAIKLLSKIDSNSRLKQLFGVLANSPFWLTTVHETTEDQNEALQRLRHSTEEYVAALQGVALPKKFTSKPPSYGSRELSWSWPEVHLGALVRPFKKRVFIAPSELTSVHRAIWEEDEEQDAHQDPNRPVREGLIAWISSIGGALGGWQGDRWQLPDLEFDRKLGYGWTEMELEDFRNVFLSVRPIGNELGLWLQIEADDNPRFIPSLYGYDLAADVVRERQPWGDFYSLMLADEFGFHAIEWSEWAAKKTSRKSLISLGLPSKQELQPGNAIAFCDEHEFNDWTGDAGVGAWLHDMDHPEMKAFLLGLDPEIRFAPAQPQNAEIPVPCRDETIAGFLLRTATSEGQPAFTELLDQAKALSDAGMGFHESLLDKYRTLISSIE